MAASIVQTSSPTILISLSSSGGETDYIPRIQGAFPGFGFDYHASTDYIVHFLGGLPQHSHTAIQEKAGETNGQGLGIGITQFPDTPEIEVFGGLIESSSRVFLLASFLPPCNSLKWDNALFVCY
jgi:hypothetical protein